MNPELEKLLNAMRAERGMRVDSVTAPLIAHAFDLHVQRIRSFDFGEGYRVDAGESAVLARQLMYFKAKEVMKYFAATKARQFIPVSNEIPSGAETYATQIWTQVGSAAFVSNYATDFPSSDSYVEEIILKIASIGNSYTFTIQDLRRAAMAASSGAMGMPLDQRKASAARLAHEQFVDRVAALGDTTRSLGGFWKGANVTIVTGGSTAGFTGQWLAALGVGEAQDDRNRRILHELLWLEQYLPLQSYQVFYPDTLLLPPSVYSYLATTPFSMYDSASVLRKFIDSAQYIRNVDQWHFAETANAANNGPRLCMYSRNVENVACEIPQEFEQFAPQQSGLVIKTLCHSRCAGTTWYQPLSGLYADNIGT